MAEEVTSNILDKIMGSQTQNSINEFDPLSLVSSLLSQLKDRDKQIVSKRFGLDGAIIETLEAIGKNQGLTRERVRQIEKDSLNLLKNKKIPQLDSALELIFETLMEHGSIMSEEFLLETLLPNKSEAREQQAVRFLLNIGDQFRNLKDSTDYFESWYAVGFDLVRFQEVIKGLTEILKTKGKVLTEQALYEEFKKTSYFQQHQIDLTDRVIRSYLSVAKTIQVNPYSEVGLQDWSEVKPRDVGDKAFLVLKHHGKPEHYSAITKMINDNHFDHRTAFQETVHNELIKDLRFVLVGRGIYALADWGYKKGVVADVIKEIMKSFGRALSREEIITEVMKRRQVKRNTILVGLSNRKNFAKVGKDKYTLAEITT